MLFIAYVNLNELELIIAAQNKDVLNWYCSLEELYLWCGEGADYSEVFYDSNDYELLDGNIMCFDDLNEN